MYNPDKQARATGGRFGGKVVTAATVADDAKALGSDLGELATDTLALGQQAIEPVVERVVDIYDHYAPAPLPQIDQAAATKANVALWLLLGALFIVVVAVMSGCVHS
jgi:hypothetical protein